jgi:hypothetical protein
MTFNLSTFDASAFLPPLRSKAARKLPKVVFRCILPTSQALPKAFSHESDNYSLENIRSVP